MVRGRVNAGRRARYGVRGLHLFARRDILFEYPVRLGAFRLPPVWGVPEDSRSFVIKTTEGNEVHYNLELSRYCHDRRRLGFALEYLELQAHKSKFDPLGIDPDGLVARASYGPVDASDQEGTELRFRTPSVPLELREDANSYTWTALNCRSYETCMHSLWAQDLQQLDWGTAEDDALFGDPIRVEVTVYPEGEPGLEIGSGYFDLEKEANLSGLLDSHGIPWMWRTARPASPSGTTSWNRWAETRTRPFRP